MPNSFVTEEFAHYNNAPIVEAVLEATFARTNPVEIDTLAGVVQDNIRFPKRLELMTASGKMTVGPAVSASATTQRIGYQFFSLDNKFVVHCRTDGLAVSRLAPYLTWEEVFDEFLTHWSRYLEVIKPDILVQLAVRYINRFDVPGERVELKDYFRTYPEVSEDIPYDIAGFLNQLQIPMPDINGYALVTQARVPPSRDNVISILLDIAVSKQVNAMACEFDIAEALSVLRLKKNTIFEACMKKQARDLIRESTKC